jgi:hypothetical protein
MVAPIQAMRLYIPLDLYGSMIDPGSRMENISDSAYHPVLVGILVNYGIQRDYLPLVGQRPSMSVSAMVIIFISVGGKCG